MLLKVLFLICVMLIVLALIASRLRQKIKYRTVPLFTPAEKRFLLALDVAARGKYRVFGKVRIADVLRPAKGLTKKQARRLFWQTSAKHFDFVVCDQRYLNPVCVVELNDSSHNRKDRRRRDDFVDEACKSAGLPILWVQIQKTYDVEKLREQLSDFIKGGRNA